MQLLVTGQNGQIARALVERAKLSGHSVRTIGRQHLDLEGPAQQIINTLLEIPADAIISAAAYTAVDDAEMDRETVFAVNEAGAAAVARAANEIAVPLIHLSTDYVFNGGQHAPYKETDAVGPACVYGESKRAGELAVSAECENAVIVRTAWVYSPFGSNFAKTMLRLATNRDCVRVVDDQLGNPTSAFDIADGILAIANNLIESASPQLRGTFHMAGSDDASWADFAEHIFENSRTYGGPHATVERIATAEYPTKAHRPANSRLNCAKLAATHKVHLPGWRQSLPEVIRRIVAQEAD